MPRTPAKLQAIRLFGWAIDLLDTGNFSGRGFMVSGLGSVAIKLFLPKIIVQLTVLVEAKALMYFIP